MSKSFELIPQDVLFFKDARPMEASDAGLGANWPRPDQLYNAFHNNLIHTWPEMQEWEGAKHDVKEKDKNKTSSFRFGPLKMIGPFPKKGNTMYFPRPLDWDMILVKNDGVTNLPKPLTHMFLSKNKEKTKFPQWIDDKKYASYLSGNFDEISDLDELFSCDRNIGIAISAKTGTAEDGRIYQAEYLRLNSDVSLAFEAECVLKPKKLNNLVDVLEREDLPKKIFIGGQRGVCHMVENKQGLQIPKSKGIEKESRFVRWTLLTPAVNNSGMLPGWVDVDSGNVKLKQSIEPRRENESREQWKIRQNSAPSFSENCKLIAACVGKPVLFSGWDLQANKPKGTVKAVPAGSVYIFECESIDEAKALIKVLSYPNRRSDVYGEKGFGVGVCSFYNLSK